MEFSQRKPNRISDYDYSQNGAYFVTICTHDRQKNLSDIVGDGFPSRLTVTIYVLNMKAARILSQKSEKAGCFFTRKGC